MPSKFRGNRLGRFAPMAFVLVISMFGLATPTRAQESTNIKSCTTCHTCDKPSADNLCLKKCQRIVASEADKKFAQSQSAPDVIVLDKLSELYVPVVFPHRLHASMEAMSDGCKLCHHHEKGDKPQPCSTCHQNTTQPGNLWQPGLRGAYHRQCLSCHRDWSGETSCAICHAKRVSGQPVDTKPDVTDIIGRLHPNVAEPAKKIYKTPKLEDGTLVTFNHQEHVQIFGKRCVDCHAKENCNRCHKRTSDAPKHIRQEPHQDCAKCHDVNDDCAKCHMKTESPGFDHTKRSSFVLKAYHQGVACRKCHQNSTGYQGLKPQCSSCHAATWAPKDFDHAKSGKITLNDQHRDGDCAGCHPHGMGTPIKCESCHDKTYIYPQKLPGDLIGGRLSPAPVNTSKGQKNKNTKTPGKTE